MWSSVSRSRVFSLPATSLRYLWVCFGGILRNVPMFARLNSAQIDSIELVLSPT